jgi:hypothetical protein
VIRREAGDALRLSRRRLVGKGEEAAGMSKITFHR